MIQSKTLQEFRLSKEHILPKVEKYLERGFIYRLQFPPKQNSKLKEWGLIIYNDRKCRYDIVVDVYNKLHNQFKSVDQVFTASNDEEQGQFTGIGFFSINNKDSNEFYPFLKDLIFKEDFSFIYRDQSPGECLEIYRQKSGSIVVRDYLGKYRRNFKSNEFFEDILNNSYPGRTVSDAEIHNQLLPMKYFQR